MTVNITNHAELNNVMGKFSEKVIRHLSEALADLTLSNASGEPEDFKLEVFNQPAKITSKEYYFAEVGINLVRVHITSYDTCIIETNNNDLFHRIDKSIRILDEMTLRSNTFNISAKEVMTS